MPVLLALLLLLPASRSSGCQDADPLPSLGRTVAEAAFPSAPYEVDVVALLTEHRRAGPPIRATRLLFEGVGLQDVYNISAPVRLGEREVIAGRVETGDDEFEYKTQFFQRRRGRPGVWAPVRGADTLPLQDPTVSVIHSSVVVGGVEVFPSPGGGYDFFTGFWSTRDPALKRFLPVARGPADPPMKDIRVVQLCDGRIGVATRPQNDLALSLGANGTRGSAIGFTIVDNLSDLSPEVITHAPLLPGRFQPEQWGGVNQLLLLPDCTLGVVGHGAVQDPQGKRHYYFVTFRLDPETGEQSDFRLNLERKDLGPGRSKRPDLVDVLFTGGLIRNGDGTATWWGGAGDAEAWSATLPDPFFDPAGPSERAWPTWALPNR